MRLEVVLVLAGMACRSQSEAPEPANATAQVPPPPVKTPEPIPVPVVEAKQPAPEPTPPAPPPPPPPPPTTVKHQAPNGIEETCQLLVAFPFQPADVKTDPKAVRWYRKDDFEEVAELCAMSLYEAETHEGVTAVGICPKMHWSTPALEVHALDKTPLKKMDFEKQRCRIDRRFRGAKKLAKFKIPVYSREPESALLYFHFSRLLGTGSLVMPITYRTVSRAEMWKWSVAAIRTLQARELPKLNPLTGWYVLYQRHRKGPDTLDGVISENARGERYHKPFAYYPDMTTRIGVVQQFRAQPYYKVVASKKPVSEQMTFDAVKRTRFDRQLQALATAQDFTHMMILDHLFNQRDRGGNINAKVKLHYLKDQNLRWKNKADADDDVDNMLALERLLLKDNDDGLIWDKFGYLNASKLIGEIRHLDSLTYERIQWLAKLVTDASTKDQVKAYFVDHVHITPKIYDDVRDRLIDLAERLEKKHADGTLMLDLDLEPVLARRPAKETKVAKTSGAK